jgi:hypothetical protein
MGPPIPIMKSVNSELAKVGESVTITGKNLGKRLAEDYLTDGKNDFKLEVVEKSETALRVRIPVGTPPGHFRFMVLTSDKPGVLVEQPPCLNVIANPTGD